MHIFITGGTGFIGKALVTALIKQGHSITVLTRQNLPSQPAVRYCQNFANLDFNDFDVVINLAGEPIFNKRWNQHQKYTLIQSRINLTQQIVEKINQTDRPPHTFLSGSATGFYGHFTKNGTEQTACGTGFASQLCAQWEAVAQRAQNTRICLIRTGMVLAPSGGALKRMLPLYRLGLGGKLGSGKQYWGWISLEDQIQALLFLLENPHCQGAFNFVAPQLITQSEFNSTLAEILERSAPYSTPEWLLKFILGERAHLLLDNQPIIPQKLLDSGYHFRHPLLKIALSQFLLPQ